MPADTISQKSRTAGYAGLLFAVAVWGASFIATKIVLKELPVFLLIWGRFITGWLILLVTVAMRKTWVRLEPRDGIYFALLGFLGIAFHQWLQSTGLQTSAATTTAWIITSTPVFIAILGWKFLKERLSALQISGIVLAAAGVLAIVTKGNPASLVMKGSITPGDILILISSLNWAVFSVLSRKGLKTYPAATMMFYVMTAGVILLTIPVILQGGFSLFSRMSTSGMISFLFLGILCSGFAYIFWYDGLKLIPAGQVGVFLYIEPVVTMLLAAWLLKEPILISTLIGGVCIVAGVYMVNRRKTN